MESGEIQLPPQPMTPRGVICHVMITGSNPVRGTGGAMVLLV
jgi:hypothetical protein